MIWFKKRAKKVSAEQQLLDKIEAHYYNNQGFIIAKEARERLNLDPFLFVYGEVAAVSIYYLLKSAQPNAGDIFYDLGSGSGKGAMTAALFFPQIIVKGVEYLQEMHELSKELRDSLLAKLELPKQNIELIQADLHSYDFSDANIVFINATGFFEESLEALIDSLMQVNTGTRIIISSKQLPTPYFELLDHYPSVPMSWGDCQVNLYQRT